MQRRLETLGLLARLQDEALSEQAQALTELQQQAAALTAEQGELARRRHEAGTVTMPEAMAYRGTFLAALRRENDRINTQLAQLDSEVDRQRDSVLESYQALRANEQLQEIIRAQARTEAARSEQGASDEAGTQGYLRAARRR
ncbi:flagellar FliJ family protein [Sulfitobacter aestuarii]|uniref:Flagellar FliJ protein n=1 Tax=Sulfitobacter aestuarii TaxID=2161676 RepID=A0ABW5U1C0_9RHOB